MKFCFILLGTTFAGKFCSTVTELECTLRLLKDTAVQFEK